MQVIAIPKTHGRARRLVGGEGTDLARCRICGKRVHLISGRHLLIHGTDRETYMEKYRLSPDQLCSKSFRLNHSSRRDFCPHNKREWIAAIKAVYQLQGQVYAGFLQKHYPNLYREGIWLFDDWDTALRAARFAPDGMRLWAYWDEERVTAKIRLLRQKGVPLYAAYALRNANRAFGAALRIFGSWRDALTAAGIEVPDNPHDGRRGVLRALREGLQQHSGNDLPEKLKLHAAYYFGSLEKAKAALKTDRRISAGWSKAKIIAEIRKMHKSAQPLGYAAVRRINPRLVSAAEAYFGTWGNALYAAGFDPNLYLRLKWRKRSITAKEIVLAMAIYLSRPCPRCNGYLGVVMREPGRNTPLRAINGHCAQCGHRLAWILLRGKGRRRNRPLRKDYAEPTKDT